MIERVAAFHAHNANNPPGKVPGARPLQGDLLSGLWQDKPPKRGNGSHIQLKRLGDEKPVVPGMASYAGDGPDGKRCRDCRYFGEVALLHGSDTVETNKAGCVLYAQHMGHASPTPRRNIELCHACKYFEATVDQKARRFIVDQTGATYAVPTFPENLRRWRPDQDCTPVRNALADASPDGIGQPTTTLIPEKQ